MPTQTTKNALQEKVYLGLFTTLCGGCEFCNFFVGLLCRTQGGTAKAWKVQEPKPVIWCTWVFESTHNSSTKCALVM